MFSSVRRACCAAFLLPVASLAAEQSGAVGVHGMVDRGDRPELGGVALGGGYGLRLTPQLWADGQLRLGLSRELAPLAIVSPGVRAFVSEPFDGPLTLSGHLGLGPAVTSSGVLGSLRAGLDADIHLQDNVWLRTGLTYHTAGTIPAAGELGVGLVFGPRQKPEPEPTPEPVAPPAPVVAEEAPTAWVPHPVCEWVPEPDAKIFFENYPGRWAPPPGQPDAPRPAGVVDLPDQGSILIAAWPGDSVLVDGQSVNLAKDEVAIIASPSGFHPVAVSGSGRSFETEVLVEQGFGVWVVPPRPGAIEVRFPLGSAELTQEERALLAEVAAHRGVARFRVDGSYSADGDPVANEKLAAARAQAVVDALVEAGVPQDMLIATTSPPDPKRSSEEQRRVRIIAEVAP